ncbi:MAG TPA: DUF4215 domain-containing protein, partial [Candidatus Absconditabacterales bacterium]|nr:DUF4215 domain-containing protein [Candidatus Absconditabacterales bacterium]
MNQRKKILLLICFVFLGFGGNSLATLADLNSYYFGSTSVYTSGWNAYSCTLANQVTLQPGTNVLGSVSANTVYYFSSGTYQWTTTLNVSNPCVVFVGLGQVYFSGSTDVFDVNASQVIFDNLRIKAAGASAIIVSSPNVSVFNSSLYASDYGIFLSNTPVILHSSQIFNNNLNGLHLAGGGSLRLIDSQIYNNGQNGIYLLDPLNSYFNNVQIFNNAQYGLHIFSLTQGQNSFNNVVSYNNAQAGIYDEIGGNLYNNVVTYNNGWTGFWMAGSNSYLHRLSSFGNGFGGFHIGGAQNSGYDQIVSNSNGGANFIGGFVNGLGSELAISSLGWIAPTYSVTATSIACADVINPGFLSSPCSTVGAFAGWNPSFADVSYSVGGNYSASTQVQSVIYNGSSYVPLAPSSSNAVGVVSPYYQDLIPDSLTFFSQTPVATGTAIDSNSVTIGGITKPVVLILSGFNDLGATTILYSLNGGGFSAGPAIVSQGDSLVVRLTSSTNTGQISTGILKIGGLSTTFLIGTDGVIFPSQSFGGGGLEAICGDGFFQGSEECDDGNLRDGDGCSAICKSEALGICGNAILESREQCDDGNNIDGDGCSATCKIFSFVDVADFTGFSFSDSTYITSTGKNIGFIGVGTTGYLSPIFALGDRIRWYVEMKKECRFTDLNYGNIVFTDTAASAYGSVVDSLLAYCLVQGRPGISARPFGIDDFATKAEFIKVLMRAFMLARDIPFDTLKPTTILSDVNREDWFYSYVNLAQRYNILNNSYEILSGKTYLKPHDFITQTEALSFLARVMRLGGKNAEFLQPLVNQLSDSTYITRGEMAKLFQSAYGLRSDRGKIMKSKNIAFWKAINSYLGKLGSSYNQVVFLQKVSVLLNTISDTKARSYALYRKGLVADIAQVLSGKFIAELSYR